MAHPTNMVPCNFIVCGVAQSPVALHSWGVTQFHVALTVSHVKFVFAMSARWSAEAAGCPRENPALASLWRCCRLAAVAACHWSCLRCSGSAHDFQLAAVLGAAIALLDLGHSSIAVAGKKHG